MFELMLLSLLERVIALAITVVFLLVNLLWMPNNADPKVVANPVTSAMMESACSNQRLLHL